MSHNFVVAGMGFGDEGKGTVVEYLARKHNAKLVVRYNGGHQAAHNVVLADGTHHTFAQYGSGTLAGVPTHLSRFMVINPLSFSRERDVLHSKISTIPIVTVERDCLITTPYHKAANQLRELTRRHGSCGVGIGTTKQYALENPDTAVRAGDLGNRAVMVSKLEAIRKHYIFEFFYGRHLGSNEAFADAARPLLDRTFTPEKVALDLMMAASFDIVGPEWLQDQLRNNGTIVFEGAQGVLLDEKHGFFPHVTYSDCTYNNALELIAGRQHTKIGVTRTYMTRHGPGPFVTEDESLQTEEKHNSFGNWQLDFRVGNPDLVMLEYAKKLLDPDALFVTHADLLDQESLAVCFSYFDGTRRRRAGDIGPDSKALLAHCKPEYEQWGMTSNRWLNHLSELLNRRLAAVSYGPTYEDKRIV